MCCRYASGGFVHMVAVSSVQRSFTHIHTINEVFLCALGFGFFIEFTHKLDVKWANGKKAIHPRLNAVERDRRKMET